MRALCRLSLASGTHLIIPVGVLAQVWREPATQVPLGAFIKGPTTIVEPLDRTLAEAAGILCGRTGTSDIVDASVVLVARRRRAVIVTSDPGDLRRLDATVPIERI
jgi:hypothetical protein